MKLGVTLPVFRDDPDLPLDVARRAEEHGIDGVFVFDHLWHIGQPARPALSCFPMLAAVASETQAIRIGSLVARIGAVPNAVLVNQFQSLQRIAGDRLIAGIGVGDKLSKAENDAYGVPFPSVDDRVENLREAVTNLRERGAETWVGGRSPAVREMAAEYADSLNLWAADSESFALEAGDARARAGARPFTTTWGGQVLVAGTEDELAAKREKHGERKGLISGTVDGLARALSAYRDAGADWVVCAPLDGGAPQVVEQLAEVRSSLAG